MGFKKVVARKCNAEGEMECLLEGTLKKSHHEDEFTREFAAKMFPSTIKNLQPGEVLLVEAGHRGYLFKGKDEADG